MKGIFVTIAMIAFSFSAQSQAVERITGDDVKIAAKHPRCSGGSLTADARPMPENTTEEIKIASYMKQFRAYRGVGTDSRTVRIQFSDEKVESDARIREVTPNHFQIEPTNSKTNTTHCLSYTKIGRLVYDSGGTMHLYIMR